jgi:3-methyladenine DNA glycosylase AlkD
MTSVEEVLQTLESLGSEQARKTYRRHGVKGPLYGISYADQNKLAKKLKTNHRLAVALWASKNHDARILAMMIADPQQATSTLLDDWVTDLSDYIVTDALSVYVGKTPLAREMMETWTQSPEEWIGAVGWNVLASLAKNDQSLTDAFFEPCIGTIARDIHTSQNRTRYSMNNALIAIGMRNAVLEPKAIDAATHIGKVIVDHGDTGCKTRDAVIYIKKANARIVEKV